MSTTTETNPTASVSGATAQPASWTCPFCSLLCDGFSVRAGPALELIGSDCPRACAGLAAFDGLGRVTPCVDGASASLEAALDAAADRLAAAHLPLFGGLATDVQGMRALYQLANVGGAILDHAHGEAMMPALRMLQDRGQMFTTLAEIRNRADLIVCIGTDAVSNFPEFFRRCAPPAGQDSACRVVFLGAGEGAPTAAEIPWASAVESVRPAGDIFDTVAMLAALVDGRRIPDPDGALAALADAMRSARYCVLVWEPARLPPHGALVGETLLRLLMNLNRKTRAGAFTLGGNDGAQTANGAMSWLSGLPLRSRVGPQGVDHDPLQYASARLLDEHAVDLLLWVASFTPDLPPPQTALPCVVLGHPALAKACAQPGTVFIPVATPGINADGHLLRSDNVVSLPLYAVRDDGLPTVAEVARALVARLTSGAAAKEGAQ
ncbi:formylmethanofuran dehydrogenase [Thauera sp.]|jgi:formylmethanofuran dehydrogenase subunit B|uniref:formylmethanofuran dehydrogenase n=1 Tax=Thauera sp. TaxID=1905334 RepID=UPI002A36EDD9|nr:formylmethanofuran dehydrogenase [Thauera sp.]MDX9887147.1 formylmethanofuran dehydrogenase [Thauera sp.]